MSFALLHHTIRCLCFSITLMETPYRPWHNKTKMTLQNIAVLTFIQRKSLICLHYSSFFRSSSLVSPHSCPDLFFSPLLLPRCTRVTCCRSDPFKERRELRWAAPLRSDQSRQRGRGLLWLFLNGKVRGNNVLEKHFIYNEK